MPSTTHPPAAPAVTAEHPVATAGRLRVRYGLLVVIAWIDALKYTKLWPSSRRPPTARRAGRPW